MVDPSPVLTSQGTDDAGVYRPVSGLAIAGLALSVLYTGSVLVSGVVALNQGVAIFLPGWMVLLAILGAGLSVLAMWQIRRAEGTRAGLKVAQWGLWLSVISGLGYTAYTTATAAAIKDQANHFLTVAGEDAGFFPLLEKGETNAAFLLTQTFARRTGSNARDEEAMRRQYDSPVGASPSGLLSQFFNHHVIRMLRQAHLEQGAVKVEPAGVRNWSYQKGYKVERNYRITTPEVALNVLMVVQSTESDSPGEGRKWFVVWPEVALVSLEPTPAGQRMHELRMKSREFVEGWVKNLGSGRRGQAFLETLEPKERGPAESQVAARVAALWWVFPSMSASVSSFLPVFAFGPDGELGRRLYLPGYDRFAHGSYLKMDDFRSPAGAPRAPEIRADFERAFQEEPATELSAQLKLDDPNFVVWEMTEAGRLRIAHGFQLVLLRAEDRENRFVGRGRFVVETAVPGDPRTTEFAPQWRLVEVDLDRAAPLPRGKL